MDETVKSKMKYGAFFYFVLMTSTILGVLIGEAIKPNVCN